MALFDASPPAPSALNGAFLIADAALRITAASAAAPALLGLQSHDLTDQPLLDVCYPLLGYEPQLAAVIAGTQAQLVIDQLNLDEEHGLPRYTSLLALPHAPGLIVLLADVTEHSRQQQRLQQQHHELLLLHEKIAAQNTELRALNHELAELSQRKSDMLAIATHDLRAPLASAMGFVQLLLGNSWGALAPQQIEPLRAIQRQHQRVLELINTLLDLRRFESTAPVRRQAIDLDQLTAETVRSFADQAALARLNVTYQATAPITIRGDREVVQQAIANLVSNALKYTFPGGAITLRLRRLHEIPALDPPLDPALAWCALDVRDNGPGIAAADLDRLFEPFFRAAATRAIIGSGLGLAIVQAAAQQHGGRVTVASAPGAGSTFTLWLPCLP